MAGPKRPRIEPEVIAEARDAIGAFLAAVDTGQIAAPTPRDVAIVRRLQGAHDTLSALARDASAF